MKFKCFILLLLFLLALPVVGKEGTVASTVTTTTITLEEIKASYQRQDFDETIHLSKRYLETFPNDTDAFLYEGLAYMRLHQYQEAITIFQIILLVNPQNLDARFGLIDCFWALKQYSQSLDIIQRGLIIEPENSDLLYREAKALTLLDQKEEAIALLRKIMQAYPYHTQAESLLKNLQEEQPSESTQEKTAEKKQIAVAKMEVEKQEAESILRKSTINLERIKTLYKEHQFDETIKLSKDYLKIFPNDVDASFYAGLAYKQLHRCQDAIVTFKPILQTHPQYLDARFESISCLLTLKKYGQALEVAKDGLNLSPDNIELLYLSTKILVLLNKKQAAERILKQILQKQAHHTQALLLLKNLEIEKQQVGPTTLYSNTKKLAQVKEEEDKKPAPRFVAGIFTDNMVVNVPGQMWNLSNLYGYWITPKGAFGASVNYANRYNQQAAQVELNAAPNIGKYFVLDLAYAYANKPELFANHLERAELFAYLPKGIEGSFGGTHRQISHFKLDSVTGSLGKYLGRYYLNFRPIYFIPKPGPTSILYRVGLRRYGDKENQYIGVVYMNGTSPDLTDLLTVSFIKISNRFYLLEGLQPITETLGFQYGVGYEEMRYPNRFLRTLVHFNIGLKMEFM
ncbi:TPA: YaiO family outer membrane beta-barrel protein [Legionella feeleii]